MIKILQISDIHFHAFPGDDEDEYRNMRQKFLEDLDYVREHISPIDTILICGDIAFSGKKEEYDVARVFIKEILIKLTKDGKQPNVFTVPGNHDKDRSVYEETRYVLNKILTSDKSSDANVFINKIRKSENETLKILYAPLTEYNSFASDFSSIDDVAASIIKGESLESKKVTYSRTIGTLGDYTVSLHGLNSTLSSDRYDFSITDREKSHKLFLPKIAYNQVRTKNDIFVSVVHHPIEDFLINASNITEKFDNLYHIQLFGHIHKQSSMADSNIKIYSGALQPDEQDETDYFPVYNIITLDVVDSLLSVEIISRKWNGSQFEMYPKGAANHTISLAPKDTWSPDEKAKSATSKQEVFEMDNKYKIQKRFLDCELSKKKSVMKSFGFEYDKGKKEISNSLLFIESIEKDNKWSELSEKLKI